MFIHPVIAELSSSTWLVSALSGFVAASLVSLYWHFKYKAISSELSARRGFEETSEFGICLFDIETRRILDANQACRRFLELPDKLLEFDIYSLASPDKINVWIELFRNKASIPAKPVRIRVRSGRHYWIYLTVSYHPVRRHSCARIAFHDITEAVQMREQLEMAKVRLDNLIKASPDGLMVLDFSGKVLFISNSCSQFETEEGPFPKAGENFYEAMVPAYRPRFEAFINGVINGSREPLAVFDRKLPDGSMRWVEIRTALGQDPFTGEKAVILSIRNATKRIVAEQKAHEHAQHLEEALQRITKLQNDVLSICAWTKQVQIDGKWVPVDVYLSEHLGIGLTHDISDEGITMLEKQSGINLHEKSPGSQPLHSDTEPSPQI